MACRWIKRLLSSTSRVLLAVMLLGAELSTAIYAGYDVTNTQLAVVLASVNALTVLLTFLLPEMVTFKSRVKDQDIERGSLLRRTVSAPASSLSDETMDLECVTPDPATPERRTLTQTASATAWASSGPVQKEPDVGDKPSHTPALMMSHRPARTGFVR